MFNPLKLLEKTLYFIRDLVWDYPDKLVGDRSVKIFALGMYKSGAPYSHFVLAFLSIVTIVFFFTEFNIKTVFGKDQKVLTEAVIMGVDAQGRIQKLNKVNPILPTNIQLEKDLVELIYEPLIHYEYVQKADKWEPQVSKVLAADVIKIKQGADYEFILKKGVKWHDGVEFSADDVISTFNLVSKLNKNDNAYIRAFKQLRWEKIDNYSVRLCTKASNPDLSCDLIKDQDKQIFSNFLELISIKILPAHKISDINDLTIDTNRPEIFRAPVGTGKYKFQYSSDQSINLVSNEDYQIYEPLNESDQLYSLYKQYFAIADSDENLKKDLNKQIENYTKKNNLEVSVNNSQDKLQINKRVFPDVKNIQFKFYKDLSGAIQAIQNGEVDTVISISVEFKRDIEKFSNIKTILSPVLVNQYWGLYFNLKTNPDGNTKGPKFFSDVKVRRAISSAINRDEILSNALLGVGQETYGPITDKSSFFNSNAGWYKYDSVKAQSLLEEAGWSIKPGQRYRTNKDNEQLKFSLYYVNTYDRQNIAEVIKKDLANIGVEVIIDRRLQPGQDNSENAQQGWSLEEINEQVLSPKSFDMILYGMNTFIDPDRFELFDSTQQTVPGLNIASYTGSVQSVKIRSERKPGESSLINVPKIDKLLEDARGYDPDASGKKRSDSYNEFQSLLAQDSPVVFLYNPQFIYYSNTKVKKIDLTNVANIEDRFKDIEHWRIN